jgi:hypothetical protein
LFNRRILNFRVVDSVIALAIPLGTKHGMILQSGRSGFRGVRGEERAGAVDERIGVT